MSSSIGSLSLLLFIWEEHGVNLSINIVFDTLYYTYTETGYRGILRWGDTRCIYPHHGHDYDTVLSVLHTVLRTVFSTL